MKYGMKKPSKGKTSGSKRGVYGSSTGSQMGAPKMGDMQTPARLANTRRMSGKRR